MNRRQHCLPQKYTYRTLQSSHFRRFLPNLVALRFASANDFDSREVIRANRFARESIVSPTVVRAHRVATSLAFYRSQKGLSLENSEKKSERGSQGLSAPGSKKLNKSRKKLKKGRKLEKSLKNCHFRLFFGFFSTPGPRGPENPFRTFFSEFFRERPFLLL